MGTKFSIKPDSVLQAADQMSQASVHLDGLAKEVDTIISELDSSLWDIKPFLEMVSQNIRSHSVKLEKLSDGQKRIVAAYKDAESNIAASISRPFTVVINDGGGGTAPGGTGGNNNDPQNGGNTTPEPTELTDEQKKVYEKLSGQYGNEDPLDLDGSKRVVHKDDWLEWAIAQNGFTEGKNDQGQWGNKTPFGLYTGSDNQPWCASFVSWCLFMSGDTTLKPTAVTYDMMVDADEKGLYRDFSKAETANYVPKPGDIFYKRNYPNNPNDKSGHVGFISSVVQNPDGSVTIKTIEGNRGQQVKSRTFNSMDEFRKEVSGVIEMDREGKTSYSNNLEASPVQGTGTNGDR